MTYSWQDVLTWIPMLLAGFRLSLEITGVSLLVGLPLGLALAFGVETPNRFLRVFCVVFVEIGRGAPALVLLQFMYFGMPSAGLSLTAFSAAVAALGWCTGAYTSEIMRAGMAAVPQGQIEAADALGFSGIDAFRFVISPQAVRIAIPPLLGFSILLFQSTSLCFVISLPEIVSQAYRIGSSTFMYLPALALSGLLFASVCLTASLLTEIVEGMLKRSEH